MRLATSVCALSLWFGATALADDAASKISGTWSAQDANDTPTTWVFGQRDDTLKVTEMSGAEKVAAFECNTVGRDCEIKDAGKKATVSMWFNGSKLVELETKGSDMVKRRFSVSENGDTMEVEVIPISQSGKAEIMHFRRIQVAAQNQD